MEYLQSLKLIPEIEEGEEDRAISVADLCDVSSVDFCLFKSLNGFNVIIIVINSVINYLVVLT